MNSEGKICNGAWAGTRAAQVQMSTTLKIKQKTFSLES